MEKVLFEIRNTERGREIFESAEWRAYHSRPAPPDDHAHELREVLDALQGIYDELYEEQKEA